MLYLNLLIMQLVIVFILDLSGVMLSIKKLIWRSLFGKATIDQSYKLSLKPFDCSLCSTWWYGLIWLLVVRDITMLNIGYVALLAYMTTFSKDLILTISELLNKLLNKLNK